MISTILRTKYFSFTILVLVIIGVVFTSGCIQQPSTSPVDVSTPTPTLTQPVKENYRPTSGIVFVSESEGGIFFMDENGGNVRRITTQYETTDNQPSVSPDGTKIVFSNVTGVMVINIDGTGRTMLVKGNALNPTWSPDGKKIYFSKRTGGDELIFSINADGTGGETQVSPPHPETANAVDRHPSVSPDGTKIAFTTWRQFEGRSPGFPISGAGGIMIMNTDGSGMTMLQTGWWEKWYGDDLYEPYPMIGGHVNPGVSWSPDGSKIAFSAYPPPEIDREGRTQIYVMNSDGTGITQMTFDNNKYSYGPSWSPDGTKMVFWKEYPSFDKGSEIYIMNSDGSSQKALTNHNVTRLNQYPVFLKKPR